MYNTETFTILLYVFEMYLFPSDEIAINQGYYTIFFPMYECMLCMLVK